MKVTCSKCNTIYKEEVLKERNLESCPVCGQSFSDVVCQNCKTTFKREVIEQRKNSEICPVCGERLDGEGESKEDQQEPEISNSWELYYSSTDIKRFHSITITCKCGGIVSVDIDKFEILSPEQCQLKEGEVVKCIEPSCKNTLTSDYLVLAEEFEADPANIVRCPTCGSINVKKINTMKKAGAIGLFNIFSAGYIAKTFECKNCHYTW